MSSAVTEFRGTMRDHRSLLACDNCEANTFKIVKRGASEIPVVECANCECEMMGVKVDV